MANLFKLVLQSTVLPSKRETYCPALGVGTVVEVVARETSDIGLADEYFVRYLNYQNYATKRSDPTPLHGWLARNTQMERAGSKATLKTVSPEASEKASAIDALRERAYKSGWRVDRLCNKFGKNFLDELQRVIRELGGRPLNSYDAQGVIDRALNLLHVAPIKEKTVTDKALKSPAAKKSAKTTKAEAPARSMARTVGNALAELKVASPIVARLQKDQPVKKAELIVLRDKINETAEKARESNQGGRAAKLSAANRLVRRLARQA